MKGRGNVDSLNHELISYLNDAESSNVKVWASIPEYIEGEQLRGYSIGSPKGQIIDDINKQDILEKINGDIDLVKLRKLKVFAISSDDEGRELCHWSSFKCFYAEVTKNERIFLLVDGMWYKIADSFSREINEKFQLINRAKSSDYLSFRHSNEAEYNKALAKNVDGILCDKKLVYVSHIPYGVEICDVLSSDRKFIHVKRYAGSAVLSHLFNQGLVSGELLKNDSIFRSKTEAQFKKDLTSLDNITIVFGIITKKHDKFDLPFFSKITLLNVSKQLLNMGFNVEIAPIKDEQ